MNERALRDKVVTSAEAENDWGARAPSGLGAALLRARQMGFVHGALKKSMARLWSALDLPTPVDIRYAGLKFRVHPWDNTVEYKMLFGSKRRDWTEIKRLEAHVRNGGVFLDVGANIGYYALMAVRLGASQALAFEPNPKAFARLAFNIAANGLQEQVIALPLALGERAGSVTMTVLDHDMGGSTLGTAEGPGTRVEVEMKPLLDVLSERGVTQVDALKIDVEGLEDRVLTPFFSAAPRALWPGLVIIEHTSQSQWHEDILSRMLASGYKEIDRNRSNALLRLDR